LNILWTTDHQINIVKTEVNEDNLENMEFEEIVDTTWLTISMGSDGFFRKTIDSSVSIKK